MDDSSPGTLTSAPCPEVPLDDPTPYLGSPKASCEHPNALRTSEGSPRHSAGQVGGGMSSSQELTQSIQRLLGAYRHRLQLRVGLAGIVGCGCVTALLWRLWLAGIPRAGLAAVGGLGLLAVGGWIASRWRRERLASTRLSLDLDRALGLEARLITASELAPESSASALYPVLLEETRQAVAAASSRFPRVMDRWTALLAVVLLMLLWRPRPAESLLQLAQHVPPQPQPTEPLPPPQPEPPQPPQSSPQSSPKPQPQQGSSAQRQPRPSQGAQPPQPSKDSSTQAASSDKEGKEPRGDSRTQNQSGDASPHGQPSSPKNTGDEDHTNQAQRRDRDTSEQDGSRDTPQGRQADSPQTAERTSKDAASDRREADQRRAGAQTAESSGRKQDQRQGQSQEASAQQGTQRRQAAHASAQGAQQTSGSQSPMDQRAQEALKGDIQQLLKQLSEELQSLQARVDDQRLERSHPTAGTSTDPQLYDDVDLSPQADASRRKLPVQLQVDQQPVATRRPGGGVGDASDEVADESPQQLEENAKLSQEAVEAEAIKRRAIPPEYQPVFDRLSSQPEESSR